MTEVCNHPYLSQIQRGLSEPSAGVLKSIAQALNLLPEALFAQDGFAPELTTPTTMQPKPHHAWTPIHRAAEARAARRVPQLYRTERSWDGGRCGGYLKFR